MVLWSIWIYEKKSSEINWPLKLENVVELEIFWNNTPRSIRVGLDKLGQEMPNLETLSIYQAHGSQLKLEMILSFKNLKSLHVNTNGSLCGLVDMLHSLEKMKNLDLSFNISTDEKMRNVEEIDFLFKKKTEAF